ncbi:MAG: hypothetical protein ACFFED_03180 [Candidatus Thorarchaeota archaeon]
MSQNINPSSRYYRIPLAEVQTEDGRNVNALKLRIIPKVTGQRIPLRPLDRLDTISYRVYGISTRYWRIADAHSELDSKRLIKEDTRKLEVPEI